MCAEIVFVVFDTCGVCVCVFVIVWFVWFVCVSLVCASFAGLLWTCLWLERCRDLLFDLLLLLSGMLLLFVL